MNEQIKKAMLEGRAILFLGAGSSVGSTNSLSKSPPLGQELAQLIAEKVGWGYEGEPLGTVYSAARKTLAAELDNFLSAHYRHVKPSSAYNRIAKFPWARIYTVNIDDAMEFALGNSPQRLKVRGRNDRIEDKDQLLASIDYVYLNGTVKRPDQGYIFSPEEYGKASADVPRWYDEVASDYLQCTFIFIGTKLAEPTFYHQVERYKKLAGVNAPLSYIFLPKATSIEIEGFDSFGLRYQQATIDQFADWIEENFPVNPTPTDIAQNKIPELRALLSMRTRQKQEFYADLLKDVTLVSRQNLRSGAGNQAAGTIKQFYKGFKPTWQDIIDAVPAILEQYQSVFVKFSEEVTSGTRLFPLLGPAGSGKSTLLKWMALKISEEGNRVYFVERGAQNVADIVFELESSNSEGIVYIFFDRLDPIRGDLTRILAKSPRAVLVAAESQNVWANRLAADFSGNGTSQLPMREISESDVEPILEKIRSYGPWTRLAGMSKSDRKKELFIRSKRQLLIGLMETTTGVGFEEIISRDFNSISGDSDKIFFIVVCMATMHRTDLSVSVASRTLGQLSIFEPPAFVASRLDGLVESRRSGYVARHPIYARKIVESIVDRKLILSAASSLIRAFAVYDHPVVHSLDKNDATLFRSLFNHRFLDSVLRGDENDIIKFYSQFEKLFESDGLFWLQYGLALRGFKRHKDAYEILQTAYNAYPHDHTRHALAQQKMIIAAEGIVSDSLSREYLADAIKLLEALDHTIASDDTYPIVALAEGHVKVVRKLDGDSMARIKASEYVRILEGRLKRGHDPRLDTARKKLFSFAAAGRFWDDE